MIDLELINENNLTAPEESKFQTWVNQVASDLKISGDVCIKIVDEAESQNLNYTYRSKDKPTNVLSFPSEIPDFVKSTHLGDLAICAAVIEREAIEQSKPFDHHWAHISIHGILHLLGYDHIEDDDADEMEALEIDLLTKLGVENPYL